MTMRTVLSVEPFSLPFDAQLTMPGSKSHANRAIIAACLAQGTTTIVNATPCDDVVLLVRNLRHMGFLLQWKDRRSGTLVVHGGIPQNGNRGAVRLFCGNAGTTLRFLTSLACIVPGRWTITGNKRMRTRPIGDLTSALRELGADIEDSGGVPPLRIRGGNLRGGSIVLDASKSSQFLSSLLLIGPLLSGGLSITLKSTLSSPTYVDLTRKVLSDFGVRVGRRAKRFHVSHASLRANAHYPIEGDWSAAGAFLVLAEISKSRIRFANLHENSTQGDRLLPDFIAKLHRAGDISIHCDTIPDQIMNLAVLAAHRRGVTRITGARNLRLKETDRLNVLACELQKTGIRIVETEDGLVIRGGTPINGAQLETHDDHRMAMCYAILGALHAGIRIVNPDCVSKSYPRFFRDLRTVHASSACIAIVGMRGAGKSTLGREVAKRLHVKHIDTDDVFVRSHGSIRHFVQKKGWSAFRRKEERIVKESLLPRSVVSLGGGAIESERVRALLRAKSIVVFLEADVPLIFERLKKEGRPPLTNLPLEQEVHIIMKKRSPLYRSVARIIITEQHSPEKTAEQTITSLQAACLS